MQNTIKTISSNGRMEHSSANPHLPELPQSREIGAKVANRAISLTFILVALAFGIALLAAVLFETDITVDARGVLEPSRIWLVRARTSGVFDEVLIMPGDSVREGQLLARLEALDLKSRLDLLQSQYDTQAIEHERSLASSKFDDQQQLSLIAQAEAQVIRVKANLRERLISNGFSIHPDSLKNKYIIGSHVAIDLALSDLLAAEAELQSRKIQSKLILLNASNLQKQKVELAHLETEINITKQRVQQLAVCSPITGIVLTENIERIIGAAVQDGQLLFEVADPHEWRANLFVREQDVHKIRIGDAAKLEMPAFYSMDRYLLHGTVVSVAQDGASGNDLQSTAFSGLYRVTIAISYSEIERLGINKLRRGYSIRGKIITKSGLLIDHAWNYLKEQIRR